MRPGEEGLWGLFSSAQRIAWKTGTSFGFRDGWAIGFTPRYCVVVWVGNTTGEGRPDLTGINTAAPIMFEIFRLLPNSQWFQPPASGFMYMPVCHQSGYKAGENCSDVDTIMVSERAKNAPVCPYHKVVHLDATGQYQVTSNCLSPSAMQHRSWFILPPAIEYYYRQKHADYKVVPLFLPGCDNETIKPLDIIYPEQDAKIYVPLELTGARGKTVFTATDRNSNAKLFWHLDDAFIGTTTQFHQMAINPSPGKHMLTVIDENGESVSRRFEILQRGDGN
jgi:penicillin-binding protein 1C